MNTKTNTKIRRTIASVALVGMGMATMFTATAAASPSGGPGMGPGSMIDLEDLIAIEEIEILIGTDVTAEPTGCIPSSAPVPEGIDVDVTNNNPTAKRYQVFMYDGTVEGGESPEFTFPEEPSTESDIEFVLSYNTEEFDRYWGMTDNVTVVRVEVVQLSLMPGSESIVVFDKEVTICEEDANAQLAEAAAEYAAEVASEEAAQALIEAQEAAEAAEQALAEAQEAAEAAEAASAEDTTEAAAAAAAAEEAAQAAIAQANAEREAAEAALAQAEAEKELALAQVEVEKAKADAMLAQANEEGTSENTPEDTSSETPDTSDEELAAGEDLGEHSKSGMSGVVLGLIIVLGLVGVGAVTGAVLNLRKQR